MTTAAWSTRIRHDSDALFREWGSEFAAKLLAVGLTQTGDTSQINWATVNRAGANSFAGYEMWRFNDTQQATAPIFIKIQYGTGSGATDPAVRISLGTGSNGSGTLTGLQSSLTVNMFAGSGLVNNDTLRTSYMCYVDGFFGVNYKLGAGGNVESLFTLCRTVDSSGVADADGAHAIWWSNVLSTQAYRYAATAVAYTARTTAGTAQICIWPMTPAVSLVGSDEQAGVAFTISPRVRPLIGICGVINSEFPTGNSFTSTQVGSTPRTYLALSSATANVVESSGTFKIGMLWE